MAKKFLTSLKLVNLSSDPLVGSEGELYFNSSASVAKIYKQGAWSELGAGGGSEITVSTTEPASPAIGDAWYKNDTGEFYVYDGTYWVEVNGVIESSGALTNIDSITYPDYIVFDTTPENTSASTGTIYWDNGDSVLKTILNANVELGIGQESVALVKNTTGSTIPKGRVVYINGAAGQRPTVNLSDADAETSSTKTFGITAEAIEDEQEGFVVTEGILRGLNTSGLTEGGAIWLSSSAGYFTQMHPVQPQHGVFLGYVVKAHASSGEIFVKIQNGYELEELHNVLITAPLDNQALVYNSSASLWYNESIVNSVNGTVNQILVDNSGIGDVTFSLSNDLITPGDLTVTGNLTVSGSTTYLNTQTLNVEDNIVLLNSNVTGAPSGTAGIEIERGSEVNTSILWDESTQTWKFSNDIQSYALRSDNVLQLDVSASVGSSGEIDLMTDFAELNINTDGSIDLRPGDVSGLNMYKFTKTYLQFPDTTQQNTAFLGMSSYDTDDLNEGATNLYFTNQRAVDALNSTLTNYLTQSSASSTYLTQADASSNYLTQASASSTYLTTETDPVFVASDAYQITSASTAAWNESYSWGDHSSAGYSLTSHNHSIDSLSNVVITGTPTDGQALVWDTSTSKWINETVSGGASYPDQTGNDGKFLQTNSGSVSWQNVNFSGYLTESSASSTYLTQASAASTYLTTESDTFETVTDRGASSTNAISITNSTAASSPTTGALIVTGGVGIGEDLYVNNDVYIGGDINITGSISGSLTYVNVTDLVVTDPLIYLAEGNPDDSVDIGIFAALNHGSSAYYHAGLIRDASDSGKWKLASQLDDPVNNVIDFTSATFDTLKVGALEVIDSSTTRTNLGLGTMAVETASNYLTTSSASSTYLTQSSASTTYATISSPTFTGTVSIPTLNLTNALSYSYGGTGLTTLGTAGQVLTVNAGATAIEWATPSGGGGGGLTTTTTSISTNSATAIESFAIATSRTAEAIIQITQGTDYYSSKVLLIHDGTTVKMTEYAILESTVGAIPLTISAAISGSNLELLATITDAATTNATAKVILIEVAV